MLLLPDFHIKGLLSYRFVATHKGTRVTALGVLHDAVRQDKSFKMNKFVNSHTRSRANRTVARSIQTQNRDSPERSGDVNTLDWKIAITGKCQKHSRTTVLYKSLGLDQSIVKGGEPKPKQRLETFCKRAYTLTQQSLKRRVCISLTTTR